MRLLLLAALMLAAGAATAQHQPKPDLARPGSSFSADGKPGKWATTIARTPQGHLIGNPEAEARLAMFLSYTCPDCADFVTRGEPALDLVLIAPGTMSLELRPQVRGGLDLAVSLLAQCGDAAGFRARHRALMRAQPRWLAKARAAPASQQAIWERGDRPARLNAASALGLTDLLARRGQSRSALDACLSDDAAAKRLRAGTAADRAALAIGTVPAFALDGKLLTGVNGWDTLYPVLSARFAPPPE
ncbi:DsbA family protein [Erythrobacter sp. NE805]|uniref:DsbA family protein n=1 Tax=Erythrobacter sp. NE805 TaxID=3389875 RepID=UPI00396AF930